jgi:hypothetical protein
VDKNLAFKIAMKTREYMLNKKIEKIDLKDYIQGYMDRERILFNRTHSPNGALGMFLLLNKSRFSINESNLNALEKDVLEVLTFNKNLKDIESVTKPLRIQDKFEEYTEIILTKKFGKDKISRVNQEDMNKYDFIIKDKNLCVTIEVKSDKWKYTGNISLELLRDYRMDYERNIGSILKTEATFWQVYYYDSETGEVSSEMFLVSQLKSETYKVLSELKRVLDLQI